MTTTRRDDPLRGPRRASGRPVGRGSRCGTFTQAPGGGLCVGFIEAADESDATESGDAPTRKRFGDRNSRDTVRVSAPTADASSSSDSDGDSSGDAGGE